MNILLLEDYESDVYLIKRGLLENIPECHIEHAKTLKEGREILNSGLKFDVALLDVYLPDGTGLEFLIEIRQMNNKFPVIMLTGSGDEETALTALKTGADDYIIKRSGYISQLPEIISIAIKNTTNNELIQSEIIQVLYIEHHAMDIDLTIRHMALYAPYIQIDAVSSAEEAISILENEPKDSLKYKVIVMDYRLPRMNALELIKTVRQRIKLCIPIILVTGQGNEELVVKALKLGANDYLTKTKKYLNRLPSVIVNSYQLCELKRKQEALVESELKYRLLADNSGDVIFVLDLDLNYTYISPAVKSLRGFELEEALKQKISDVLTPNSYKKVLDTLSEILHENSNYPQKTDLQRTIELEMFRKDKTIIWVEVKASLILDKNNKPVGILGVTRDITERIKMINQLISAKEKAEESDKLKTSFLANISHEIRTPMNGILGFAELLKEDGLSGDQQNDYIEIIEKSGQRMLNIINEIVDISKIESGINDIHITEVNVNNQLEFIYNSMKYEAESKNLRLSVTNKLPDNEAIVKTDYEKTYRILTNLLKNAIKYTQTGSIEFGYKLKTENKNRELEFYVKDTGIGIQEDRKEAIFERFIQADIENKMAMQGVGLGLAISKAYVEMLGGKMRLESELNSGSTFYFTIPYISKSNLLSGNSK